MSRSNLADRETRDGVAVEQVQVFGIPPERLKAVLEPEDWAVLDGKFARARKLLEGRAVWNVSATPVGDGLSELMRSLMSYLRGAGLDVRWGVLRDHAEYYRIAKRIRDNLLGHPGDGLPLAAPEQRLYTELSHEAATQLKQLIAPRDIVVLQDPIAAGLAPALKESGATVVWRCHAGAEKENDYVSTAWEFLAPHVAGVDACALPRRAHLPDWARALRIGVIEPTLDPFSTRNKEMSEATVRAILAHVGLATGELPSGASTAFERYDGSPARVDHQCDVLSSGPPPEFDAPLVVHVSRWDRLKDPCGVMVGFAEHAIDGTDAHLVLAGPTVHSIASDPDQARVFDEVEAAWRELPPARRCRVHLACIPMHDVDENGAIVNALQRQATIFVQKSLAEGFGLTVAEAMWKGRPIVASAIGSLKDQVIDGETGILLDDPCDLETFGLETLHLLQFPRPARKMGQRAREHVRRRFLINRRITEYLELLEGVLLEASIAGERST